MSCCKYAFLLVLLAADACSAASRFVDPRNPAAQDSGAGDSQQPYRTLAYAIRQVKSGDTLNIAGGVYRETMQFPDSAWSAAETIIQPADNHEVVIKGSDVVTGWTAVPGQSGLFVKRPWAVNSEQVIVDDQPLKQIGGTILNGYPDKPGHPLAGLFAGQGGIWPGRVAGSMQNMPEQSFYYDAAAQSLYIRMPLATLAEHQVEASVRPYVAIGKGLQHVTLKNLHFRHANTTSVSQSGAISLSGNHLTLESIEITHVDGNGFDITGDENVIRNSHANYCGQVGMKVRGRANQLTGNETNYNNTRGFNKWWEAGGAKFVGDNGLRDSEVSGHRAIGNQGDGLWFDWMNSNNRIHDNVAAYNTGFGIHYEASQKGYIYNNYSYANSQRGIYLPHSSDSVVAFNLVVKNGMEGIAIIDEGRSPNNPAVRPRGNRVVGNILGWNGKASLVLPAQPLDNRSDYNLIFAGREPAGFSMGWGSVEQPLRKGLPAWQAAAGQDKHSWSETLEIPASLTSAFAGKQLHPDWTPVTSVAAQNTTQAADVLAGVAVPFPSGQAAPGPRQ